MATQQLSLGGSTSPVANTGATSPSDTSTQSVTSTDTLSGPDAIYQLIQPNDINSIFQTGENGALDPFQLNPVFNTNGASPANEASSPGYQAYGQDWVNLVDTLSQIPRTINYGTNNDATVSGFNNNDPQQLPFTVTSPNTTDSNGDFTNQGFMQGSNLATDIVNATANGTSFNTIANDVAPTVDTEFGLTPGSQEANNYAQAFTTYVDAANSRGQDVASTEAAQDSGDFEHIVGDIGQALGFAAASEPFFVVGGEEAAAAAAAESVSEAAAAGSAAVDAGSTAAEIADTAGDASSAASAVDAASVPADLSTFQYVNDAIKAGGALASGNPLGAVTSLAGPITSGISNVADTGFNYLTGSAGTDATSGGSGIVSGISNTLGLAPDTLKNVASDLGVAGSVAGTAVPLVENALSAPTDAQLSALTAAATPPTIPASTTPTLTPDAPGEALTDTELNNPNSGTYSSPIVSSQTLGGGLGGPAYSQIIRELGQ